MEITKEDHERWLNDPVTREVFKILQERKNKIAHMLGNGACLADEIEHGVSVGRYQEIDDLVKMTYKDMLQPKDTGIIAK